MRASASVRARVSAVTRTHLRLDPRIGLGTRACLRSFLRGLEQAAVVVVGKSQPNGLVFYWLHDPVQAKRQAWRPIVGDRALDQVFVDPIPDP
jgi:hypothetical protein